MTIFKQWFGQKETDAVLKLASAKKGNLDTSAVVRLHHKSEPVQNLGLKRGDIIKISHGDKKVRRIVLLTANLVTGSEVAMDYNTQLDLGVKQGVQTRLHLNKCGNLGTFLFVWDHPDQSIKIGARYAVWLTLIAVLMSEALSYIHRLFN